MPGVGALVTDDPIDTAGLVGRFPELASVGIADVAIAGPHGPVPARRYRRVGTPARSGLVWAHGGAFMFGDLDMPEAHWVGLAVASRGVPVLSIDYRKTLDGVHFPVPSDDVLAAWLWAEAHATEWAGGATRLHLGGASAGAALAAGVTKRLRDGAGPLPSSLVLAYGMFHPGLPPVSAEIRASLEARPGSYEFTPAMRDEINAHYTGHPDDLRDPYAFAANGDLGALPPTYLLNSEADTLRASGEAFAAQLVAAGVVTEVEFEPGTGHGHLNEPHIEASWRSVDRIVAWMERS